MGRLRDAWNALRGYAAAQDHRASAWAPSGGSANAEVGTAAATVARRARDAVRNDPYASRIVDLWTGNAVGAGITTRWPDDAHGRAWQRWAESTACDAEGRLDLGAAGRAPAGMAAVEHGRGDHGVDAQDREGAGLGRPADMAGGDVAGDDQRERHGRPA